MCQCHCVSDTGNTKVCKCHCVVVAGLVEVCHCVVVDVDLVNV